MSLGLPVFVVFAYFVAGWALSVRRRNVTLVDTMWGPAFGITGAACLAARAAPGGSAQWWLWAATALWGLRLGTYLAWRSHGKAEDRRYRRIRANFDPGFWWKSLFVVFGLQGLLVGIIGLPVYLALSGPAAVPTPWTWTSFGLFGIGLAFETIGDWQLARFSKEPDAASRVMDRGLWRYTRHPNYFGDACVWWGLYLASVSIGAPKWTVIGPLVMTFLLLRVSGVRLLERDIRSRRPEYADYVRRTSAFVPWPPRRPRPPRDG